jgi:membrane protease subunit (stomatin/prohibitin family)
MLFVNKIVGTKGSFTNNDIEDYLKNIIVSRLTNIIGDELKTVFDMPSSFDNLSLAARVKLQAEFDGLGLSLHDFYINSISVPEDVQKMIDQRSGMSAIGNMDEFMKYKVALSLENASQNQAGTGEAMGGGLGAGMGLGMGFMMPQMIQQSMASSMQGSSEKETAMDKLKKLKELLDMGVISQDEFNQKKSKLMDQI